jgi:uncharacterized membrane protein (UPF0127 family)
MAPLPLHRTALIAFGLAAASFTLVGCDPEPVAADASTLKLQIGGKPFELELALDEKTRFHGLSDRTEIKPDGGLLFVFPDSQVNIKQFVMRDCPIAIDIIYLDKSGRITAMHKMTPEPPRTEEEKKLEVPKGYPAWTGTNAAYENRLKKYSSKFACQFAIELNGNTLDTLKLKEGQKIEFDMKALVRRAK